MLLTTKGKFLLNVTACQFGDPPNLLNAAVVEERLLRERAEPRLFPEWAPQRLSPGDAPFLQVPVSAWTSFYAIVERVCYPQMVTGTGKKRNKQFLI